MAKNNKNTKKQNNPASQNQGVSDSVTNTVSKARPIAKKDNHSPTDCSARDLHATDCR